MLAKAIYQNCPNLTYLQLVLNKNNFLELENLLINCQHLNGLVIKINDLLNICKWEDIFKMLTKSSPTGLYSFKFYWYSSEIKFKTLKLFFDNWEGRHPMLLQIVNSTGYESYKHIIYLNLIEQYKEKGVVKEYEVHSVNWHRSDFDYFERI